MSLALIGAGALLLLVSGIPGDALKKHGLGQYIATTLALSGALCGIAGSIAALADSVASSATYSWSLPGASLFFRVDALSAVFAIPVFLLGGCATVFGLGYWSHIEHPDTARKLRLYFGVMTSSMIVMLLAANGVLFLVSWEIMALAGYFLVTTESARKEVQQAGWIYFVASHASALLLLAFFAAFGTATGSLDLDAIIPGMIPQQTANALFLLGLVGFGIKAGLYPFHIWLPPAHANAPSHISAFFSGVYIKMGVYGVMRVCWLLPNPPVWWGATLLALGLISSVLGVAHALGQHDFKRLLAYHSVENIGIIFIGLGVAMIGISIQQGAIVALGFAGAMLHVWNHALFKSLLFFSAGSVIRATATRNIEAMGGLAKHMPKTASMFLVGATAICGLPPLNGFISEFLIYLALFQSVLLSKTAAWLSGAIAIPLLALTGALAVACFVKVFGVVFLGNARSTEISEVEEAGVSMLLPMGLLAILCCMIGLFPTLVLPVLEKAVLSWTMNTSLSIVSVASLAPFRALTVIDVSLTIGCATFLGLLLAIIRRTNRPTVDTWDCGYVQSSPRIQYTGSSFAQMLIEQFSWALFPRQTDVTCTGSFPQAKHFETHVSEPALDFVFAPFSMGLQRIAERMRILQPAQVQMYLVYIAITLIVLLFFR